MAARCTGSDTTVCHVLGVHPACPSRCAMGRCPPSPPPIPAGDLSLPSASEGTVCPAFTRAASQLGAGGAELLPSIRGGTIGHLWGEKSLGRGGGKGGPPPMQPWPHHRPLPSSTVLDPAPSCVSAWPDSVSRVNCTLSVHPQGGTGTDRGTDGWTRGSTRGSIGYS